LGRTKCPTRCIGLFHEGSEWKGSYPPFFTYGRYIFVTVGEVLIPFINRKVQNTRFKLHQTFQCARQVRQQGGKVFLFHL
jgi:hypothetical protein